MTNKRGVNKIPVHFGVSDYFKYYQKNNSYKLSRKVYCDILSSLNYAVTQDVLNNVEFNMPARMGSLSIRKDKRDIKIVDGKVINNAPVDWQKTLKLWSIDEEAKQNKLLIKHSNMQTNGFVFRIFYRKWSANYKNKFLYKFSAARPFKRTITEKINDYSDKNFNSYLLY